MDQLTYLQASVIGALQGVTELFPVSSLGHAVLLPAWLGGDWAKMAGSQNGNSGTPYLSFIVALHCATAVALLVFYWRMWVRIIGAFFASIGASVRSRSFSITTPTQRLAWLIVAATIPCGVLGLIFEHKLRHLFATPLPAAIFLTLNAFVLAGGELLRRRAPQMEGAYASHEAEEEALVTTQVSLRDAGVIGVAQTLALLAGISRSGITMVGGLLRGLDHESAVNFSFLLATPIIAAAGLFKVPSLFSAPEGAAPGTAAPIHGMVGPLLVGCLIAFVVALASIKFLTKYFERRSLYPFAAYCLVAGVASIIAFA